MIKFGDGKAVREVRDLSHRLGHVACVQSRNTHPRRFDRAEFSKALRTARCKSREGRTASACASALKAAILLLVGWFLFIPLSAPSQAQQESSAPSVGHSSPVTSQSASNAVGVVERAEVSADYRIGAQDLLEVNVFGAPELDRSLRVSGSGKISMPLVGSVQAAGLTVTELEKRLGEKYSTYIKDPQVGVLVSAVQSHPVSVLGAVKNPGTFQLQAPTTLLQILSKAGGLAPDAGGEVLIMRGGTSDGDMNSPNEHRVVSTALAPTAPSARGDDPRPSGSSAPGQGQTFAVNLQNLMESGNPQYNIPVYPGDIVTVSRAGVVYVVGDVNRPGGFEIKSNERMTVLKAIALAEGLKTTSAKSHTRIIRAAGSTGHRIEIPINLGKILAGKAPDAPLEAADILFVPDSTGKSALLRGTEAAIQTASGVVIWHQYQ